jgi:PPE-repeat protein
VSSPTTVDVAANLTFQVTFKNSGNFQQVKVPVSLTVSVFAKKVLDKKTVVLSILKGQTKTVSFANLNLPPSAFGANATVSVLVGKVPGETNLDNNKASYPVFFSLPSNG